MPYNTSYIVKYRDIKRELLEKYSDSDDATIVEDIGALCHKLYLDELASVFNANDFLSDDVDIGISECRAMFQQKPEMCELFAELRPLVTGGTDDILCMMIFGMDCFYLTHQIVCAYKSDDNVDVSGYISELKRVFMKVMENTDVR